MKRVLFTANTDRHILLCHMPYLKWLNENDCIVDVATNTSEKIEYCTHKFNLNMSRFPFRIKNVKAISKLIKILKENEYDLIHTHTPVGSVVTRIACFFSKTKAKVIYTCHGFHFYKGAPFYYWLLFFPIEKILMYSVNVLIVMNKEDYLFAKKHFKKTDVRFINGVGFNRERLDRKIYKNEIDLLYKKMNFSKSDFVVSYIAEYSLRKRQIDFVKSLYKTNIRDTNIKILFIGDDALKGKLTKVIARYKLESVIYLVDFSSDILPYYIISDLVISCSKQEGLPLNVMEAIYMKKILLVTSCRGNIDLVLNGVNGYVVDSIKDLYEKIVFIKDNYKEIMKNYSFGIEISKYSSKNVLKQVVKIYEELLWKE